MATTNVENPNRLVVSEKRDEPSGRAHLEANHDENQKHRADRNDRR